MSLLTASPRAIPPMSRSDPPSSGFTAVNGNAPRLSPGRSSDGRRSDSVLVPPESLPKDPPPAERGPSPTAPYHSHGWRADRAPSPQPRLEPMATNKKRKRSHPAGVDAGDRHHGRPAAGPDGGTAASPRRPTNIDSAVDVTSPDKTGPPPVPAPERRAMSPLHVYTRTRSPLARWNPPAPRPEIEAGLAESLQRELRNTQQAEDAAAAAAAAAAQAQAQARPRTPAPTQPPPATDADSVATPADSNAAPPSASYSPGRQDYDPKKRKRNFSNRTKTGCHTCRHRKKKCDEHKPVCQNCERGGFVCGGYGPKPPGFKTTSVASRTPVTLHSKSPYDGPTGYYHSPADDMARAYAPWGRMPAESDLPPPPSSAFDPAPPPDYRRHWPEPGPWSHSAPRPAIPPLSALAHSHTPLPPPAPHVDPWASTHAGLDPYRSLTGMGSSRDSATTSSSQRTASLALTYNRTVHLSEKDKMLLGHPFLHFIDDVLLNDRAQCKGALEFYNDSARQKSGISAEERGRFFRAIVDPEARHAAGYARSRDEPYAGPKGNVGSRVIIESPFTCDYGYNLHIGDDVVIQAGCLMQDACEIHIGSRTIVGPNVKFYGITASVDPSSRKGSQGPVTAGAIAVGQDCFIGGDAIIMPFRKIGNGAVIGAGSVVTKDVKDNTVVAGNPAKVIRRIDPGGPHVDRHHPDIQEQNDKMLAEMRERARNRDR